MSVRGHPGDAGSGIGGPPDGDWLALGQAVLAAQPFSQLLGAMLVHLAPGEAELHLPLKPELLQQSGFVQGGVLGYAADNTLTFAGGTRLGADVVTAEYKICMLRPARGQLLVARASTLHAGRTQAVCRCDLFVVDDARAPRLCATALGTIVRSAGS
jgi:uncharacterized protein (TIGR00369 family)